MLTLFIDADACPVKAETIKVAERYKLELYMVSNGGLRPMRHPHIHQVQVASGTDAADDWIVEHIAEDDIVITADILLAGRCLELKAHAINPNGKAFTEDNIGNAMMGRSISAHLREMGEITTQHPSFTQHDKSRFLQTLDTTIQAIKRR